MDNNKIAKGKAREAAYKSIAFCLPTFFVAWLLGNMYYGLSNLDTAPDPGWLRKLGWALALLFITAIIAIVRYKRTLKKHSV